MASEELSFENVDRRRTTDDGRTDGRRTDDGYLYILKAHL